MWAALLLLFVACASAQLPMPCAGPASFTGRFRKIDRDRNYYVEGKMYYDSVNQRVREFEYEEIGSTKQVYDKLKLYNLNIEYTVDLKTRKCNVSEPRPRTWRPFGVPPDARFRGEGTIGAVGVPNEEVTVAFFEGEFDGVDPYFSAVTQPDCFLVEFGTYSNSSGYYHRDFYDVVSGITDPEAFIPPQVCLQ
eukprot:GHVL01032562.1.p1 GENE.GHVL01032562.1~~GHVL01032562.1.p1  ORF type:complete len:193 (+),score=3.41 GHVL01032562.1:62-640(+)